MIGPREVDRIWERHLLNSVVVSGMSSDGASVVDVGSGAGLPGIPLAIARPDLSVTLLEPLLRRSRFLAEVVDELGLAPQVEVVRARAEEHRHRYGVVTARAVAPLSRLVEWCAPLLVPGGSMVALKGQSAADEISAAGKQLAVAGLEAT
ncbi:MAG: 16S rRNA (guanine(527)-N(7))-methyltransferase RsmG, partial [Propioniciclava sp.]